MPPIPFWLGLDALLRESRADILRRERESAGRIYAYSVGGSRVSLERSACALHRALPGSYVTAMELTDMPFPVVLAVVSEEAWSAYAVHHRVQHHAGGYESVAVDAAASEDYGRWRHDIIEGNNL